MSRRHTSGVACGMSHRSLLCGGGASNGLSSAVLTSRTWRSQRWLPDERSRARSLGKGVSRECGIVMDESDGEGGEGGAEGEVDGCGVGKTERSASGVCDVRDLRTRRAAS
eukprot:1978231-Prymnesium_polylepis.1